MKRPLLLLLLSAGLYTAHAQPALHGKWKYADIYEREQIDSTGQRMVEKMFAHMFIYLKPNQHYKAGFTGKTEEGQWAFDSSSRKIILHSGKGETSSFEVIRVSDNQLIIKIGKKGGLVMSKTPATAEDETETAPKAIKTVAATRDQLAKKWFLKRREKPGLTPEQVGMMADYMGKGSFYEFFKTGECHLQIFKIEEKGRWELGPGNTSVIIDNEGRKKIWNIYSISEKELVLILGNKDEKWIFSTVP